MKSLVIILCLLSVVLICGCSKIKFDRNYKSEDIEIELVNIEDSRCPTNAECFWAGEVLVTLNVSNKENITQTITLGLFNDNTSDTILFNHDIKLVKVNPYPEIEKQIELEDYSLKLDIKQL